jgi:uncharacterized protein YuzE
MRISYDADVDILTIDFDIKRIKLSEEVLPGVIADFDYDGQLVGFEIMDASAFTDFAQIKVLMSRWGREYERVLDENGNFSVQPRTVRTFKPIPAGD